MTETKKERLAKIIARAGICSRRDAEKRIVEGRVQVNGQIVSTLGSLASELDDIMVDGLPVWQNPQTRLWVFYKPRGVITTHKDPQKRTSLFDLLPATLPRVISVGRLDLMSEGLILLTNDGALARELELPKNNLARTYHVRIFGHLTDHQLKKVEQGVTIDDERYLPAKITVLNQTRSNQWLEITLYEGKNREIRKIMEWLEVKVNRLCRISYGPISLEDLQPKELREITALVPQLKATLGI
jgi:23S rRNA pseudouridine2605 synthase